MKKIIWQLFRHVPLVLRRKILFFKNHKRLLDLDQPNTFSEKVNWRIVKDRREILAWTCDKEEMKSNVVNLCPEVKIPKTLWSGTELNDLSNFNFPSRWILKANHRSQCVYIGHNTPDIQTLKEATKSWLGRHQEINLGEWAYARAKPAIILEEWIGELDQVPEDYKFFVFDGVVQMIQVDSDRFTDHKIALYDKDWQRINVDKNLWKTAADMARPARLKEMIVFSEKIAAEFDFMRIDLFSTPRGIYFGETTPYPGGGLSPFDPKEYDELLGSYWNLPR